MEGPNNIEKGVESAESYSSKIELHFFRHDEKGKVSEGKTDNEVQLTETGRLNAQALSEDGGIEQSVAFGSPRLRTKETALLHMAGDLFTEEELKEGEYSLEKLMDKVGPNKVATDQNLDFDLGKNEKFIAEANEQFSKNNFLKFVVENSDTLARELEDPTAYTYSRVAGQIARIVKKYLTIAPRFEQLVEDKPETYENVMKRFLGTHQTVAECFLAKVVEKTKGSEMRDRLISLLQNAGFSFSEGFECDVLTTNDGEVRVHIKFTKPGKEGEEDFIFDEDISTELIDEIISESNN